MFSPHSIRVSSIEDFGHLYHDLPSLAESISSLGAIHQTPHNIKQRVLDLKNTISFPLVAFNSMRDIILETDGHCKLLEIVISPFALDLEDNGLSSSDRPPVDWVDGYFISENRRVYPHDRINVPGLFVIGYHRSQSVIEPLTYHFHRDCIEIAFVVKGNMTFSAKGKTYSLYGGDVFITPANIPHDTGNKPVGICEIYWVQIYLKDTSFFFLEPHWAVSLKSALLQLKAGVLHGNIASRKYLSKMMQLLIADSQESKYQGTALLINCIYEILEASTGMHSNLSPEIHTALEWIFDNLCDEIRLEELAERSGLSLSHFKRKFNAQVGMSPRMFINKQKVDYAKGLLSDGYSVTQVAYQLGFNSSNYFSTVFRKFAFLSPVEYASRIKRGDTLPE